MNNNLNLNCPCCSNSLNEVASVLLDNIKRPLNKNCSFCLCELNPVNNQSRLVSCPKCGNMFHNNCWYGYYNFHLNRNNRNNNNRNTQPVSNTQPANIQPVIAIAPHIYVIPITR